MRAVEARQLDKVFRTKDVQFFCVAVHRVDEHCYLRLALATSTLVSTINFLTDTSGFCRPRLQTFGLRATELESPRSIEIHVG